MTKYKCGHETDGVIILDDNVFSYIQYDEWAQSVGVFGDKSQCANCWWRKKDENN